MDPALATISAIIGIAPIDALRQHGGTIHVELRDDNGATTATEVVKTTDVADALDSLVALFQHLTEPTP